EGDPWPADPAHRQELQRVLALAEGAVAGPAEIEWVIDPRDQLWLVQMRPVVLPISGSVALATIRDFASLPANVQAHPKLRLQRDAMRFGVTMAPSLVVTRSGSPQIADAEAPEFGPVAGVSVVLLHPFRVENKIVRELAPVRGQDVDFFTRECRRY